MRRAVQESQASGAPGAQRAGEAHGPVKYAPLNGKTRVHRRSVASGRSGRCARMGIGVQNGAGFRRSHGARNHAVTSHRARPADTERARCDTWTRNRTSRHPFDSRIGQMSRSSIQGAGNTSGALGICRWRPMRCDGMISRDVRGTKAGAVQHAYPRARSPAAPAACHGTSVHPCIAVWCSIFQWSVRLACT